MGSVNITFRREMSIDLNAYYPNFPPALRRAIDDELFKALGGAPRQSAQARLYNRVRAYEGKAKLTSKEVRRLGTKTAVMVKLLRTEFAARPFEIKDARALIELHCEKNGIGSSSSVFANLLERGYLELVQP